MINQCGPPFCHFILSSTFPPLSRVIHSLLLFSRRGSPFFLPSAHFLPRVLFLSTLVSHLVSSIFPPSTWVPSPMGHPSVTPLCHHSLFPPLLPSTMSSPHVCPSSYSFVPGGSARNIPYPEMLSWLGCYQSQEAVIEAVEGG
jgi:hypothetical protein